jgi:hypothetical protein
MELLRTSRLQEGGSNGGGKMITAKKHRSGEKKALIVQPSKR